MSRRRRLLLFGYTVFVTAWLLTAFTTGADTGFLQLLPALALCVPLLLGRYLGERRLATLAKRMLAAPRPRACVIAAPRSHVRLMLRGGRLVACSLAKRPPPARPQLLTA